MCIIKSVTPTHYSIPSRLKMKFILLLNLFAFVTLGSSWRISARAKAEVIYVGAVIEYEPYNQWTDSEKGYGVIRQNSLTIKDYAVQAKNQLADILVTPEYGVQSLNMFPEELDKFLTFTQYVPDPADNMVPYSMAINNTNFEGMQILSSAAMENALYLVVDLGELYPCSEETVPLAPWPIQPDINCPTSGYFFYNTIVVFDRSGAVIVRYRKQHLYGEPYYTPGPQNDTSALFLTDFDVQFTVQICFDIAFEHPAYSNVRTLGIKDVILSTAWVDYLPFNLADNTQNGWSRGLKVNLLASGYHKPEKSKLGSGIFKQYSQELPMYTFDKDSGDVLLVSEVRTIATSSKTSSSTTKKQNNYVGNPENNTPNLKSNVRTDPAKRTHIMAHQNLANFTGVNLESGQAGVARSVNICSYDQFCCTLTYEYSGNLTYTFVAYSGLFSPGIDVPLGIQTCGVLWCKTLEINTCALVETGLPSDDNFGPFTIFSSFYRRFRFSWRKSPRLKSHK